MSAPDDNRVEEDTLALVERLLPRVAPPEDLLGRILASVEPDVPVLPPRHRRITAGAAALAAAAVLLTALVIARAGGDPPAQGRATIAGTSDPAVSGEAVLRGSPGDGAAVHLSLDGVPPVPAGHHYEVWVLRKGGTRMEPVGAFTSASNHVEIDLPLPRGDYAALDVSLQQDGGPPAHSGTSIAGGAFTS